MCATIYIRCIFENVTKKITYCNLLTSFNKKAPLNEELLKNMYQELIS